MLPFAALVLKNELARDLHDPGITRNSAHLEPLEADPYRDLRTWPVFIWWKRHDACENPHSLERRFISNSWRMSTTSWAWKGWRWVLRQQSGAARFIAAV